MSQPPSRWFGVGSHHRVLTDAVVAAGIASDAPLGIGVRHGRRRVGDPMLVTRSGGNRVNTLDSRPALDVHLERGGVAEPAPESEEALGEIARTRGMRGFHNQTLVVLSVA